MSHTSVTCKILEHIICSHVNLDRHNILSTHQHGFPKRHSCESQLLTTLQDLLSLREVQADLIVLDYMMAFDTVHHESLLGKLQFNGIDSSINQWVRAFLTNRSLEVMVDGSRLDQAVASVCHMGQCWAHHCFCYTLMICHVTYYPRSDYLGIGSTQHHQSTHPSPTLSWPPGLSWFLPSSRQPTSVLSSHMEACWLYSKTRQDALPCRKRELCQLSNNWDTRKSIKGLLFLYYLSV